LPSRIAGGPLGGRLEFALREEEALGDLEVEAKFEKLVIDARREIARNRESLLTEILGEEIDHLGRAGLALRPELAGALEEAFEREDDVEGGVFPHAAELERADDGVFLAARAEGDEGVGHAHAAEVERVGAAFGIGVEEGIRGQVERVVEL